MSLAIFAAAVLLQQEPKPISLFDGKSLAGWQVDCPERDAKADLPVPFVVREGMLVSLGQPMGHLLTEGSYENYRLTAEYRFSKAAGNSGFVVHCSKLRALGNFLPQGIEVQLRSGNAGDFHLFHETLTQRQPNAASNARRLVRHGENLEKPIGEWNTMIIECRDDTIKVWVNGAFANEGIGASVRKGRIAIQSEGAEVEFRKLEMQKLVPASRAWCTTR